MNTNNINLYSYTVVFIFIDNTSKNIDVIASNVYKAYEKAMKNIQGVGKGINEFEIKKKPG